MIKRKIINDLLNLKRKHVRETLLIKGRVNQVKLRLCETILEVKSGTNYKAHKALDNALEQNSERL